MVFMVGFSMVKKHRELPGNPGGFVHQVQVAAEHGSLP